MAAFNLKVKKTLEDVKESGGNKFIGESGVFPVTLNFVSVDTADSGAVNYTINLTYEGNSQTIYGPTIQNINGEQNEIGFRSLNKLFVVGGLENGQEPNIEEETHNVGKDNKEMTFNVITDLSDLECQMQVSEEFSLYKGAVSRKLLPVNFFTAESGATADEITAHEAGNDVTPGKQLESILANEGTNKPKYRANKKANEPAPTPEQVEAFKAAKRKGPIGATPQAAQAAPVARKNLFK